jgi:Spy/CpxP family protein refolding chaperone
LPGIAAAFLRFFYICHKHFLHLTGRVQAAEETGRQKSDRIKGEFMNRKLKTVMAMLGTLVVAASLSACKHPCMGGDHSEQVKKHVNASLKKVNATDEQKTKIDAVVDQISADGKQVYGANQGLKAKVVGCLLLDTPNSAWLHATVDEKAKELTAFAHRTIDHLIVASAVLSHEQRSELKKGFDAAHGEKK